MATPTPPKADPSKGDPGRFWPDKSGDPKPKPFDPRRLELAAISQGEPLLLTLPADEKLEDGFQPVERWIGLSDQLHIGQFIQVVNDVGSFFGLGRIEHIYGGGRNSALRELSIRWVAPPYHSDKALEPLDATGNWYVRWLGAWRKWAVVDPAGVVRRDHINNESEARVRMTEDMRNAGTAARVGAR